MAASTTAEPRSPWARHSPAPTAREQRDRHDRPAGLDHVVDPAGEEVGGEHDDGELEELRRLDAEAAEPDPRAGAVHLCAEAGGERQAHRDHAEHAERDHELAPHLVREPCRHDQADEAEPGPHGLLAEDPVRRVPEVGLGDRRGRQHHHEAEHHEHRDHRGDGVVGTRRWSEFGRAHPHPSEPGAGLRRCDPPTPRPSLGLGPGSTGQRARWRRAVQALERRTTTITDGEWSGHVRSPGSGWAATSTVEWGSERLDERPEMVTASLESAVVVEARTAGRQQHRLTGRGDPRGQFDRLVEPVDDLDRGRHHGTARPAPDPCRRWRSRRRPGRARPPSVTGRPPCRSRRRSTRSRRKLRIAADAACGVVALESLYHATPSMSARCSRRCLGPTNVASAVPTASLPTSPDSITSADAAKAFVMSCGNARRIAPTSANVPPGPVRTAWPPSVERR